MSPDAIEETLAAAADAVERYADEARALAGPRKIGAVRADLVHDLGRAARAIGMVEHGRSILATSRGPREMEAETSIKRGYLNLLHAREAFARDAVEAADLDADDAGSTGRSGIG